MNPAWRFFASVKLALITLIILAITSVIGTLIKQRQEPSYYVQEYGPSLAKFFESINFTNMYSSWWFVALLGLFAVNLVVCSIERLPGVWRQITMDNLGVDLRNLDKMSFTHRSDTQLAASDAAERMSQIIARAGWKTPRLLNKEGTILLFTQKGAWSRLGVYVVHLSILVILTGVMIGTFFGFQAYVFIPEGTSTSNIYLRETKKPVPLGFELKCDQFEKTFYPNGMVKQYRADLSVLDSEHGTRTQKTVIVNDPLSYRGLTFYVGDAFPMDEFLIVIQNLTTGAGQAFRAPSEREVFWQDGSVSFQIKELELDQDGAVLQARIRFNTGAAESSTFRIEDKGDATIRQSGKDFKITFRQYYSTLLLVAKDPGVLTVYSGCVLMVVGLAISFFLSHRKLWVRVTPGETRGTQILISGSSNKNMAAFEQRFQALSARVVQEIPALQGKKQ